MLQKAYNDYFQELKTDHPILYAKYKEDLQLFRPDITIL